VLHDGPVEDRLGADALAPLLTLIDRHAADVVLVVAAVLNNEPLDARQARDLVRLELLGELGHLGRPNDVLEKHLGEDGEGRERGRTVVPVERREHAQPGRTSRREDTADDRGRAVRRPSE
jgi:hypothetical protein